MKVTLIDSMGSDLTVVNAARVSFGKKSDWDHRLGKNKPVGASYDLVLKEQDAKLIRYLAEHNHRSPFGHCFASFHVKAPIFVARQLVKHKFLRWNEISRRYVDDEPEFYWPEVWRKKAKDKKQGSEGVFKTGEEPDYDGDIDGYLVAEDLDSVLDDVLFEAKRAYKFFTDEGVAPEMARMVLPQNMYTEWYWSGSLDAFADMCNLRCYPDAQVETKMIADQIDEIMMGLYPHAWKALRNG